MPIRFVIAIVSLAIIFAISVSSTIACEAIELIQDPRFERGFWVLAPKHPHQGGKIHREGKIQLPGTELPPAWELVQWYSRDSILNAPVSETSTAGIERKSVFKKVSLNPAGTEEGELILGVNSIEEFDGTARREEDPWPHLLIQQRFHGGPDGRVLAEIPAISQIESAQFHVDLMLETAEHQAPTSQFVMYFTIANVNRESAGYGDSLWFGVLFYDERHVAPPPYMIDGDRDHARFIYNTGITPFLESGLAVGEWSTIQADLKPYLQDSLEQAWKRGFLKGSRSADDYKITGMNFGWEVPGLSNVSMRVRNMSFKLTSTPK
ncbi:hypothetical protein SH668x_001466 [Planctomicrobium sp. SH668]|uniref:hypothetical protein n=1 Tax=Planctomicrobium sp. SH668 TaxID=3448126 RepID=UPI003F5BFB42